MRKFKFRMKSVEKHRKLQEQEKQVALSRSINAMKAVEEKLVTIDTREVEARREAANLGASGSMKQLDRNSFFVLDAFIQGQRYRREDAKKELQEKEQVVMHVYSEFVHAHQQKKIIEKLREHKHQEFKAQLLKVEKRLTDELYTTRFRLLKNREEEEDEI